MADIRLREVIEGRQYQGEDEVISYTLNTTNNTAAPTSVSVVVKDITDPDSWVSYTSTAMPTNSPTVNGSVITLSPLKSLTAAKLYRVEVKYTASGNTLEDWFEVEGQV